MVYMLNDIEDVLKVNVGIGLGLGLGLGREHYVTGED